MNLDSLLELKHANDRRSAAQAVLEGQATLVQTLVMMPEQRLEQLPSFWEARVATMAQQRRMPAFAHASRWLRETLIFPYLAGADFVRWYATTRSEEHTSELQSQSNLVCRLLLEKKK